MQTAELLVAHLHVCDIVNEVLSFLRSDGEQYDYHMCLYNGLTEECLEVTNINSGLRGACYGGHFELATALINRGATKFNMGLTSACRGKHPKLIKLMIDSGAWCCYNESCTAVDHI